MAVDHARIMNTLGKFQVYFSNHENIVISVSGGSDSDIIVHIVATYMREFLHKVHFVFVNTGLEYQATKAHLDYLEKHYNIKIERIRGKSVVWVIKHYGVPIISKWHSNVIKDYRKGCKWAIKAVENGYDGHLNNPNYSGRFHFTLAQRACLSEIMARNINISAECCHQSKKIPMREYQKKIHCDLVLTGERKAEGGIRANAHKNCFEEGKGIDKYMPLFFWDDDTKAWYKESEGIRYSDCYEVWGMKRTGCVGCPFNQRIYDDIALMQYFEPRMYKACMNVFGESYRLMDKYGLRRKKIIKDQISMFDVG